MPVFKLVVNNLDRFIIVASNYSSFLTTHKTSEVSKIHMILDTIGIGASRSSPDYPMLHRTILVCVSRSYIPNKSNGPLTGDNPPAP